MKSASSLFSPFPSFHFSPSFYLFDNCIYLSTYIASEGVLFCCGTSEAIVISCCISTFHILQFLIFSLSLWRLHIHYIIYSLRRGHKLALVPPKPPFIPYCISTFHFLQFLIFSLPLWLLHVPNNIYNLRRCPKFALVPPKSLFIPCCISTFHFLQFLTFPLSHSLFASCIYLTISMYSLRRSPKLALVPPMSLFIFCCISTFPFLQFLTFPLSLWLLHIPNDMYRMRMNQKVS